MLLIGTLERLLVDVFLAALVALSSARMAGVAVFGSAVCIARGPSWQDRRVEALKFDASVRGGETPVDARLLKVSIVHPRGDFTY